MNWVSDLSLHSLGRYKWSFTGKLQLFVSPASSQFIIFFVVSIAMLDHCLLTLLLIKWVLALSKMWTSLVSFIVHAFFLEQLLHNMDLVIFSPFENMATKLPPLVTFLRIYLWLLEKPIYIVLLAVVLMVLELIYLVIAAKLMNEWLSFPSQILEKN